MASPTIELKDISIQWAEKPLLKRVSLQVMPGESLVLIGPSGHGKSTLLKLMAGLLTPTSGEVWIEGKNLHTMQGSEREHLAKKMGMLFQKNALFDSMTAAENVAFPMREVLASGDREVEDAIHYYLTSVGIAHARDLFPDEISGGMQKRLGIARALALKPQIVFYDDPTAGLDPITSRKIIQLIKDLKASFNTTLVAVTNDMNRAKELADRIVMVVDGEALVCGTPSETQQHQDPRVQQFIHGRLEGPLTVQP